MTRGMQPNDRLIKVFRHADRSGDLRAAWEAAGRPTSFGHAQRYYRRWRTAQAEQRCVLASRAHMAAPASAWCAAHARRCHVSWRGRRRQRSPVPG